MCHTALRALQFDECPAGIVSGVNIILVPSLSSAFAIAGMTSANGRCHTFDERADGYARGEGCGGIVLQQERAEVSLGLELPGSAVRQDGRSASLTAPNGQAQQGLLTSALADAGLEPDDVALSEAHGTGTSLGDPIEARSLKAAVLMERADCSALAVGGVKANCGHAEPAAGLTGLFKLVLALQHGQAAPNAQVRKLNPHVVEATKGLACVFPPQLASLPSAGIQAGGVSSFGFGGAIAHCLLRQHARVKTLSTNGFCFKCRAFLWRETPHSMLHRQLPSSDAETVFRSAKR
eukprot:2538363-Prymnesium_polylepis.1